MTNADDQPQNHRINLRVIAGAMGLVLATFVIYLPALNGSFVWDDESWTRDIASLLSDRQGLLRMWTDVAALQQYFPLTGTTFWLDHQLWGDWTLPYHVENVVLHIVSALLFWRLLVRLAVRGAWLAAAIFAFHPVMAESVAWITERKNCVSLVFYLAAMLAWLRFRETNATDASNRRAVGFYAATFLLFIAALLGKATAFSFPAVILVIAWWKEGRIRLRNDVLPALPFFVVSIAHGMLIRWIEIHHVGADGSDWPVSAMQRPIIAGRVIVFYAAKLLLPIHLTPIYPRWDVQPHDWIQWLPLVSVVVILFTLWWFRARTGRGLITGTVIFVGTLFPVLGFMDFYGMAHSFVSDRWVYVSSLPVIALGAAGIAWLADWSGKKLLLPLTAIFILPSLAFLTCQKASLYRDDVTLMQAALAGNPQCWLASYNLANHCAEAGVLGEAERYYLRTIEIWPGHPKARTNYGGMLIKTGRIDEAIEQLENALAARPDIHGTWFNLGLAYVHKGRRDDALEAFAKVISFLPDFPDAHQNLAYLLFTKGERDKAIEHYRRVVALRPESADAHRNLAVALVETGHVKEAAGCFREVIRLNGNDIVALNGLARILAASPDGSLRNGTEAVSLAERADEIAGRTNAEIAHALAAAYAETGRYFEAMSTSQRALNLATQIGNDSLSFAIREARKLYATNKPWRDRSLNDGGAR